MFAEALPTSYRKGTARLVLVKGRYYSISGVKVRTNHVDISLRGAPYDMITVGKADTVEVK